MLGRGGGNNLVWLSQAAAGGLTVLLLLLSACAGPEWTYRLLPDSELEITVWQREGEASGPTVYVVGGTHGDETAGWQAGIALREAELQAGTLYVAAPINAYGAEHDQRRTRQDRDVNRNFPGDPEGCDAEQIAWAVFEDIRDKRPDLVLDLHEARAPEGSRDDLRGAVICQDVQAVGDLVLDLLAAFREEDRPLTLYGSPPLGSLNRTMTEELGIPVLTIETGRDEALEQRVERQLAIVEFILSWYDMVEG